ncbi:response regulator transcription factor [Cerasicoccus maritimus]|uniref:response regulator transcription factor n=1 Tax=Cerasicoccus maritimus TaxID=490089 RepID=UPI002852B9DF|nr:response regulator transcription factor [Cerasicoccus maritimus]
MMTSVIPTKIIIVEDHEVVRLGLRQLIEDCEEFEILGEAGNCRDAMTVYEEKKPDLVLLDLMLPDGSGVDLCKKMRASSHRSKILVLTSCEDDRCIFDAFAQGIDGYILKNINGEAIISALHDVAAGKSILDPSVTQHVVNHMRDSSQSKQEDLVETLSAQERRVLEQVAKGLTNKEVASVLNLSEKTVKNYFSNVLSKLYASRRTEAAALYWSYIRRRESYPYPSSGS